MIPVTGDQVLTAAIATCSMFAGWLTLGPRFRRQPVELVPAVTISLGDPGSLLGMEPPGQFDVTAAERLSRETVDAASGFTALSIAAVGSVLRVVIAPGRLPVVFWVVLLAVILTSMGVYLWARPRLSGRFCDRLWLAWIDAHCSDIKGTKTVALIGSIALNNGHQPLLQYLAARLGDPKWFPGTGDYVDIGRWVVDLARKRRYRWGCQITE